MKKLLTITFTLVTTAIFAQADICKNLIGALPNLQRYDKYSLAQGFVCEQGYITTYYTIGDGENQQVFSIILTDTKQESNHGMLEDAESKYEIAKKSSDKSAMTVSRLKLGTKSIVSHDVNTGTKRIYGYKVILKNRYVLDIMVNNNNIMNLNQFQDFISDYVASIKEYSLPN
ncbi:hypothetical protein AM493_11495 [Flavobacterium akiainvivens]|uniref:Secreted protein n=1 Tax=Flavobacterium akiainvivens TaxID=1202724 RepID=A0A0M8MIN2_9FLAO|nr:hypothetical protein [Flavobacterium akiainvivens]KOS06587.1 hypothetical protein AM493_11495 [Flavobacterium akiainvivens]SFQ09839.1 hypothetical protein SAMN05444144_10159 [Flavobacterium akiainvivens]